MSQRAAWKSSMKICDSSRLVCTQRPTPVRVRSNSAIMMPSASRFPAVRSLIGDADTHRALARQAGDRHEPAHALHDLIDASALAVRPVLSKSADAAIDDAGIDLAHVLVGDVEPVLYVCAHVLDDHVGALYQPHERCAALGRLQVEPHHALVAVQVLEIRPVALAGDILPRWTGGSTRMTSAPQSARCRTQVGPARASVRSRTVRPESGRSVCRA